jgi:hypothetical protein
MTLTLPPAQTITTLRTDADDAKVRTNHQEAMDRCWLMMESLGTRGTEKG